MERRKIEQAAIGVLIAGFATGTITHALHLATAGWVVFDDAPVWMNAYWTALALLDPLTVVLLLRRRRTGSGLALALAAAIIVSDVAINSYALYGLGLRFGFASLQMQTMFCGFLLGSIGFLLPRPARAA